MHRKILLTILIALLGVISVVTPATAQQKVAGIYITQTTAENAPRLQYLIDRSKEVGINTFVIDLVRTPRSYQQNIELVKQNGIRYVARIVMFPEEMDESLIMSQAYWEKKYQLAEKAIALGAQEIQLDYVRYRPSHYASDQNAQNIYQVIKWFKNKLRPQNIPLQIDVFGITSFGDSKHIGQSLTLFAPSVEAICPMVYPSHYEPYEKYAKMPYFAIYSSLQALHKQFNGKLPFKVYPFIETYNYRHYLSEPEKLEYIAQELKAIDDSNVDGWYFWNIHNQYDNVFAVLRNRNLSNNY